MTDDELKVLCVDPYYVEDGERKVSPRTVEVLCATIFRLLAEKERLREVLEFYAAPYDKDDQIPDFYSELDFGERARAALEHGGEP